MKKKIISVILCLTFVGFLIGTNNKEADITPSVENIETPIITELEEEMNSEEEKTLEEEKTSEEEKISGEEMTSEETENKDDTPMINFWGYTGYLDECNSINAKEFQNCDYDGDGLNDRVYKWYVTDQGDGNDTMYRIEFGNGDELILDRAVPEAGFPYILVADFSQNDKNEIVFGCTYWTSTDPMAFGELAIFEKEEDGYRPVELPMKLSDSAYTMTLDFHYEKVEEQLILVTCEDADFSKDIEIDEELWEVQGYNNTFSGATYPSCVWNAEIVQNVNGVPELKCYLELFDKWTCYGVSLLLQHQDSGFVYDGMELITLF